jgi:hypothetical protein
MRREKTDLSIDGRDLSRTSPAFATFSKTLSDCLETVLTFAKSLDRIFGPWDASVLVAGDPALQKNAVDRNLLEGPAEPCGLSEDFKHFD